MYELMISGAKLHVWFYNFITGTLRLFGVDVTFIL